MSDDGPTIDDAISGYQQLAPRQVTIHEWRVLSWRNDDLTAHKVNLRNLTCGCPDQRMNNEDDAVCAHLAAALFAADRTMDVGTALNFDLVERQRELEKIASRLEQTASSVEAEASHLSETAANATQTSQTNSQTTTSKSPDVKDDAEDLPDSDVGKVEAWIESDVGAPAAEYSVDVHEQFGSINVHPEGQVDWWKDMTDAVSGLDNAWWDGDDRVWIIQDAEEVPA